MNPAARQVALLNAQAAAWEQAAAGGSGAGRRHHGGIPAVARLLRVVAGLPTGAVVLPGLDTDMADDAWDELDDCPSAGRPGAGCCTGSARRAAMSGHGRSRRPMQCAPRRGATLARALLPAEALVDWQDAAPACGSTACRSLVHRRPAGGSRRDRAGAARGAGNAGRARRSGHAGSRSGRPGRRPSCCATAWSPTTAPARHWPRRRRRCSCACWSGRSPRNSRRCRCWRC